MLGLKLYHVSKRGHWPHEEPRYPSASLVLTSFPCNISASAPQELTVKSSDCVLHSLFERRHLDYIIWGLECTLRFRLIPTGSVLPVDKLTYLTHYLSNVKRKMTITLRKLNGYIFDTILVIWTGFRFTMGLKYIIVVVGKGKKMSTDSITITGISLPIWWDQTNSVSRVRFSWYARAIITSADISLEKIWMLLMKRMNIVKLIMIVRNARWWYLTEIHKTHTVSSRYELTKGGTP